MKKERKGGFDPLTVFWGLGGGIFILGGIALFFSGLTGAGVEDEMGAMIMGIVLAVIGTPFFLMGLAMHIIGDSPDDQEEKEIS